MEWTQLHFVATLLLATPAADERLVQASRKTRGWKRTWHASFFPSTPVRRQYCIVACVVSCEVGHEISQSVTGTENDYCHSWMKNTNFITSGYYKKRGSKKVKSSVTIKFIHACP